MRLVATSTVSSCCCLTLLERTVVSAMPSPLRSHSAEDFRLRVETFRYSAWLVVSEDHRVPPVTVPGRASNVNSRYRIAHDNCVAPAQRHESEYYVDSPIASTPRIRCPQDCHSGPHQPEPLNAIAPFGRSCRIRYGITIDREWMRMLHRVVHCVRPRKVADSAHGAFTSLVVMRVSDIFVRHRRNGYFGDVSRARKDHAWRTAN